MPAVLCCHPCMQNLHDVGWMSLAATGCMISAGDCTASFRRTTQPCRTVGRGCRSAAAYLVSPSPAQRRPSLAPPAVFATLIKLLAMPGDQLALTSLLPPPETRAIEGLIAALNLSFAVSRAAPGQRKLLG